MGWGTERKKRCSGDIRIKSKKITRKKEVREAEIRKQTFQGKDVR